MKSKKAVTRDVNLFALVAELKPLMQQDPFTKNLSAYIRKHHVDIIIDILRKVDWTLPDEQLVYTIVDRQQQYRKQILAKKASQTVEATGTIIKEPTALSARPKFDVGDVVFITDIKIQKTWVNEVKAQIFRNEVNGQRQVVKYCAGSSIDLNDEQILGKTELLEMLYKLIDRIKGEEMVMGEGELELPIA